MTYRWLDTEKLIIVLIHGNTRRELLMNTLTAHGFGNYSKFKKSDRYKYMFPM